MKKKSHRTKLGLVIDAIMQAESWNQTQFGERIGAQQSMVSRMIKGDEWEQHYLIFLKLLCLMAKHGMLPDLYGTSDKKLKTAGAGGFEMIANSTELQEILSHLRRYIMSTLESATRLARFFLIIPATYHRHAA